MSKILIVEDESVMSDVQKDAFSRVGILCDVAEDGVKALKFLKKNDYNAIVMDIVMPHMDGLELLKQLQENPRWRKIPVIVLSNLSQESDRQECKRIGNCHYLLKTQTSLEVLVKVVKSL